MEMMPTLYKADLAQMVEEEVFSIVPSCLDEEAVQRLSAEVRRILTREAEPFGTANRIEMSHDAKAAHGPENRRHFRASSRSYLGVTVG
jgi:hypothetical protein